MSPSMVQTVGGGLLVSPSLAQPRGCTLRVRPPRVTIVVQTRGSTSSSSRYRGSNRGRDSRWQMGGCVNIHTVRIQVSVVVQTGGKVTCTSWALNPWCEVQPRVATPWCEVQTLGSTPWCEVQPLVSQLDDAAARVHVVVLLGGECMGSEYTCCYRLG